MPRNCTHRLVARVNADDLVVLVNTVLVNPVRVQDTQVAASLANTLFRNALQAALGLEVVDTLADGFTIGSTLGDWALAATATNTDTVDDIALLGLVSKTAGLVRARRSRGAVDDVQLTELY